MIYYMKHTRSVDCRNILPRAVYQPRRESAEVDISALGTIFLQSTSLVCFIYYIITFTEVNAFVEAVTFEFWPNF